MMSALQGFPGETSVSDVTLNLAAMVRPAWVEMVVGKDDTGDTVPLIDGEYQFKVCKGPPYVR